jgi:hypothetical protein
VVVYRHTSVLTLRRRVAFVKTEVERSALVVILSGRAAVSTKLVSEINFDRFERPVP